MSERFFKQSEWRGGQADSEFVGLRHGFYEALGIDIHSLPGVIRVSQRLDKKTASTVTDFCRYAINASDGNSYWFGDTGKIYKRTSGGTWSLVHTDSNGAIIGAAEFNGFIYWATATKLGRQSTTNAAGEATWSSHDDNWNTLDTASFHLMTVSGLFLYIGNDRKLASVDDSATFTAAGTPDITWSSLQPEYSIKTMINYGIDILIGANITTSHSTARVFRWDQVSPTYITDDDIPENGINAFIPFDNIMYVQAGDSGHIYIYNGTTLERVKKIRGDYANKTMTVHPGSVCNFQGKPLFGVSNLSSNPCIEAVYSLYRYDRNYPIALMPEFVISPNVTSNIEVGAMLAIGSELVIAWKNNN